MLLWFSRLPLTLRLPLLVAAMIFVAAVATTQLAIRSTSAQFEQQIERIGQVYLDGLAAAVVPAVAERNVPAMTAVLQRALTVHVGVQDRELAILDAAGDIIARARRSVLHEAQGELAGHDGPIDLAPHGATLPAQVRSAVAGMIFDDDGSSVWVWRPLPPATTTAGPGTIVANLDVASFLKERRRLRQSLLLFDLALSSACAGIGFFLRARCSGR